MALPEKREPSHVLTVTVPLWLDEVDSYDFDAIQDVMGVVLGISRVAYRGAVCGDVTVTLDDQAKDEP